MRRRRRRRPETRNFMGSRLALRLKQTSPTWPTDAIAYAACSTSSSRPSEARAGTAKNQALQSIRSRIRLRLSWMTAAAIQLCLDQPAFHRNRLKAKKLIDSKVLEQLIRVQTDAGRSSRDDEAWGDRRSRKISEVCLGGNAGREMWTACNFRAGGRALKYGIMQACIRCVSGRE